MATLTVTHNWQSLIDEYGELDARIKDLQDRKNALRYQVLELGTGSYDGRDYRVTVSQFERDQVDYKAIVAKLSPSRQLLAAHTETLPVVTVKVALRRRPALAA